VERVKAIGGPKLVGGQAVRLELGGATTPGATRLGQGGRRRGAPGQPGGQRVERGAQSENDIDSAAQRRGQRNVAVGRHDPAA
jgi:hypothetical protein